jgi:hypothetical protein
MTIDELIDLAFEYQKKGGSAIAGRLATGVIGLLSEAQPCGYDSPMTFPTGFVEVPSEWSGDFVASKDARAMGIMLLRASDEAEASANRTGPVVLGGEAG